MCLDGRYTLIGVIAIGGGDIMNYELDDSAVLLSTPLFLLSFVLFFFFFDF